MSCTPCVSSLKKKEEKEEKLMALTHIFPPSSLICSVTTASPIHTMEKTPEKTSDDCSSFARTDRNMLKSKQNMSGPLADNQSANTKPYIYTKRKEGSIP